jgi:hypothetical protein
MVSRGRRGERGKSGDKGITGILRDYRRMNIRAVIKMGCFLLIGKEKKVGKKTQLAEIP